MKIVLATQNPGKVTEMKALLAGLPVKLYPASAWPDAPDVEEDHPTLEGNARKKAEALYRHTGLPALADDTALEVVALGGRPGVRSARYAGLEADPVANRALLRSELQNVADRRARFRTVIALATTDGVTYFEGICNGHLLEAERGSGGFGYDALFVPEGETHTFAELDADKKNAISHRGRALRAFAATLGQRLGVGEEEKREKP